LIEEYFKRDLTEAEEQQLADWFSAHPEDTERMAQGMADLYLKSGLPEPVWPGGNPPFGKSGWWVLKPIMPLLLAFALLGAGAYKWLSHLPSASEETLSTPVTRPLVTSPDDGDVAPAAKKPAAKVISTTVHQTRPGTVGKPAMTQPALAKPVAQPSLKTPALPAAQSQGHVYEQLSVAVAQATPGLVTVKVKDNLGTEVRTLFAGIMPQGNQTIPWDGKTENGALAPAGTYFIEVKSGGNVQRKEVHLQGDALP
jgi:hypothetical protein